MPKKPKTTQETPKGVEIPVPKRGEFFKQLKKAAKPSRSSRQGCGTSSKRATALGPEQFPKPRQSVG